MSETKFHTHTEPRTWAIMFGQIARGSSVPHAIERNLVLKSIMAVCFSAVCKYYTRTPSLSTLYDLCRWYSFIK
jgi:hypothetical protein